MSPTARLLVGALLSAVPVAVFLLARGRHGPERPQLRPGRLFLFYTMCFSGLLMLTRSFGLAAAFFAAGTFLGLLGSGRLVRPIYGGLYSRAWIQRYPEVPARDAKRWHLALLFIAVLCFVGAMIVATQGL